MEKILFKKISINFIIVGVIVVSLYSLGTYKKYKDIAFHDCNQLLNQVSNSYEKIQESLEDKSIPYGDLSIDIIIKSIPTIYDITIFAIDKANGDILGITKNNEQNINFDKVKSNKGLIDLLKKSSNGRILKINGSYKFLKSKIVDDIILVGFKNAENLFNVLIIQFLYCLIIVCFAFFILIRTLKRYFKKYVFNDFNMIEKNIKEIISGKLDVSFETKNPDLKPLVVALNYWKDSYGYRNSRMTKIISSIDQNIGLFECFYYIKQNFFSDNLKVVLGIDDRKWNEIKERPRDFENYIKGLLELANDDGIVFTNNKYLFIKSYSIGNEFFGIIVDKSDEIKNNEQIIKNLKSAAEKDSLTNLLNRNAFEKYVEDFLQKKPGKGTMLIFDLDNFKQINDKLGHPEGDRVLKIMSCCLKYVFRKDDIIARLGGDEFVVFIDHNIPIEILDTKLESILDNIRKRLSSYYKDYNVSTSIGVAFVDNKIYDYQDLYRCSDAALYIAKQLGKDRYYVNEDNIRCIREECIECTDDCKKREVLEL